MTVSRVLNDHLYVSPKTRKRIQGVIDELGYVPSEVARSLSHGHSNTIGVVSSCPGFSGPSRTLVGIEKHFPHDPTPSQSFGEPQLIVRQSSMRKGVNI